jgi:hypothetical protein
MLNDLADFTTSQHNILHSPNANAMPAAAGSTAGTCIKSRCISPCYISHRYCHKTNVNRLSRFPIYPSPKVYRLGHSITSLPNANHMAASACSLAGTCIKSRCISPCYISHRYCHKTNVKRLSRFPIHPAPKVYRLGHSITSLPNANHMAASACSLAGTFFKPRCISLYYLCRDLSPRWPPTTSPTASAIRPMLNDFVVFTTSQHCILHSPNANDMPAAAGSTAGTCFKSRCISLYYLCRDLSLW